MADEVENGADAPDIDALAQEAEEQHDTAPPSLEDIARTRGWKPQEEWSGEGEWRDAATFINYGLDRNKDLSRELKDIRETTSRVADTQARIMAQELERVRHEERQRWTTIHDQAVEEGDKEIARQAAGNLAKLEAQPNMPDPQVQRWVGENTWFNTDPLAAQMANAVATQIANRGGSVQEQLEEARKAVHQRFPEYAPKPEKVIEVAQPGAIAGKVNRGKSFHDLPAEAQQAARALVSRGILKNTDGYVKQYFNKEGTIE